MKNDMLKHTLIVCGGGAGWGVGGWGGGGLGEGAWPSNFYLV